MANGTHDKVQELQNKLYQAAKQSPTRRFHALYDKIHRADFLWAAWVAVARNNGAPGVDGVSIADVATTARTAVATALHPPIAFSHVSRAPLVHEIVFELTWNGRLLSPFFLL